VIKRPFVFAHDTLLWHAEESFFWHVSRLGNYEACCTFTPTLFQRERSRKANSQGKHVSQEVFPDNIDFLLKKKGVVKKKFQFCSSPIPITLGYRPCSHRLHPDIGAGCFC